MVSVGPLKKKPNDVMSCLILVTIGIKSSPKTQYFKNSVIPRHSIFYFLVGFIIFIPSDVIFIIDRSLVIKLYVFESDSYRFKALRRQKTALHPYF